MSPLGQFLDRKNPPQEPAGCPSAEDLSGDGGFLVLSRKKSEDIVIEVDGIVIVVRQLDINGNRSRLGIKATKAARILRGEIYNRIYSQGQTK